MLCVKEVLISLFFCVVFFYTCSSARGGLGFEALARWWRCSYGKSVIQGGESSGFHCLFQWVGGLTLIPFAFFFEKKKRPTTVSLSLLGRFFLLSLGGIWAFQAFLGYVFLLVIGFEGNKTYNCFYARHSFMALAFALGLWC
jgi:hypothetical protein